MNQIWRVTSIVAYLSVAEYFVIVELIIEQIMKAERPHCFKHGLLQIHNFCDTTARPIGTELNTNATGWPINA